MKFSRPSLLAAGLGMILLANTVALGGVAYNRSDEPESILRLTERELQRPYEWVLNRENSGLSLRLRWRTLAEDTGPAPATYASFAGAGGSPKWLNQAKLIALGFDARPRLHNDGKMHADRVLPREVLLVPESNGRLTSGPWTKSGSTLQTPPR
jgi:hypothetical protein